MHLCTKRPEDRRFVDFRKRRPAQTSALARRFRRFPKIEMELLFSRPPGEAAGWRKNFLALFDASSNVGASDDERNPPRAPPSQTASMKFDVKIGKTRKNCAVARRTRTFLGGRQRIRRDFNGCRGETNFSRFTFDVRTRRAVLPDLGRGRRFFRFLNRAFSRAALRRLAKF